RERVSQAELQALETLAGALQRSRGLDITIAYDQDFVRCAEALESLEASINAYREAEWGLAASYDAAAVRDLDPDVLDRQWREANASFWPNSMLGKRKIRKLLQDYA